MDILQFALSFLGGGLISGLLVALIGARLQIKRQRIEFLRDQVQMFYGPLQFFVSSNAKFFELNHQFHDAYTKVYIDQKWSEEESTRERINERARQTIHIANEYIHRVEANNERILRIIENNYSLVDPDDIEVLSQFIVDYTRSKTEVDETSGMKTPIEIYDHVGEISFMRPQLIEVIDRRFKEKKAQLDKLTRRFL